MKFVPIAVSLAGLAILIGGWVVGMGFLRSPHPSMTPTLPMTAVGFVLSGIVVYVAAGDGLGEWSEFVGAAASFGLIGLVIDSFQPGGGGLVRLVTHADFQDLPYVVRGQPSPLTGFGFLCVGASGICWMFRKPWRWIVTIACGVGVVALCGIIAGLPILSGYVEGLATGMALYTAVLFILLGVSVASVGSGHGDRVD
jgi:hypothetical protein